MIQVFLVRLNWFSILNIFLPQGVKELEIEHLIRKQAQVARITVLLHQRVQDPVQKHLKSIQSKLYF
jgi:L-rhamnose isomerase